MPDFMRENLKIIPRFLRFCCFLHSATAEMDNHFVTRPENQAVLQGQRTMFSCSLNRTSSNETKPAAWVFRKPTSDSTAIIFNGYTMTSEFTTLTILNTSINGQYDLIINDTRLENAGSYTCMVDRQRTSSAQLVVLSELYQRFRNVTFVPKPGRAASFRADPFVFVLYLNFRNGTIIIRHQWEKVLLHCAIYIILNYCIILNSH